jgi:hypothetical protein
VISVGGEFSQQKAKNERDKSYRHCHAYACSLADVLTNVEATKMCVCVCKTEREREAIKIDSYFLCAAINLNDENVYLASLVLARIAV